MLAWMTLSASPLSQPSYGKRCYAGIPARHPAQVASSEPLNTNTPPAANDIPLPDIAGIDTALGLSRVMGNRSLYRSLLQKFAAGQRDCVERIRVALAADDWALAERLAHTLKGVSGNIGASTLQQQAAESWKKPSVTTASKHSCRHC